jgi:hypothetical protein
MQIVLNGLYAAPGQLLRSVWPSMMYIDPGFLFHFRKFNGFGPTHTQPKAVLRVLGVLGVLGVFVIAKELRAPPSPPPTPPGVGEWGTTAGASLRRPPPGAGPWWHRVLAGRGGGGGGGAAQSRRSPRQGAIPSVRGAKAQWRQKFPAGHPLSPS